MFRICELGGQLLQHFTRSDSPHFFVADRVGGSLYQDVLSIEKETGPLLVRPSWLAACKAASRVVPAQQHKLAAFTGLRVSISGFSPREKSRLAGLIQAGGGEHSADLTKRCTHLVCKTGGSAKHRFAVKEGLLVVTVPWVEASAAAGCCLEEAQFALEAQPAAVQRVSKPLEACSAVSAGSCQPGASADLPASSAVVGEHTQAQSRAASAAPLMQPALTTRHQPGEPASAHPGCAEGMYGVSDDENMFLDGARVFMTGCPPAEQLEQIRLARAGGATRYPDLQPPVTHIVVGSDVTLVELQAVKEHQVQHRARVKVVGCEWLRQCKRQASLLPVNAALAFDLPAAISAAQAQVPQPSTVPEWLQQRAQESRHASDEGAAGSREATTGAFFEGRWFTMAGVEDKEDYLRAEQIIRQFGGHLFTSATARLVPNPKAAYAVCDNSLTHNRIQQLRKKDDFKLVPESMRVTVYWVDKCEQARHLLPHSTRDRVMCRPRPFNMPLDCMSGIRICASGYNAAEKATIEECAQLLGATFTASMTRKNTHLLIMHAAGAKFLHCKKFDVIPVVADWLLECAHKGQLVPEADFYPPSEPEAGEGTGQQADPAISQLSLDPARLPGDLGPTQVSANLQNRFAAVTTSANGLVERDINQRVERASSQPRAPGSMAAPPAAKPATLLQKIMQQSQAAASRQPAWASSAAVPQSPAAPQPSLLDAMADMESKACPDPGQEVAMARHEMPDMAASLLSAANGASHVRASGLSQEFSTTSSGVTGAASGVSRAGQDIAGEGMREEAEARAGAARKRGRRGAEAAAVAAPGRAKRRTRAVAAAEEAPSQLDCSQQVGYEGIPSKPGLSTGSRAHQPRSGIGLAATMAGSHSGHDEAVKQRLARAVMSSRHRGVTAAHKSAADELKDMGLM
ncbi:hypothetical protein WJX72_005646 [[Myrmecia] bisecta]|uniref:BRCT domain-containing protein n=1 Tax=[Myrmecia] bisecta TaxID=41462 RepID=A0AAW1QQL6_9CHLO